MKANLLEGKGSGNPGKIASAVSPRARNQLENKMQDDMPLPKEKPKDKYEEFVRELPFCRTYIERFKKQVLEAHVACGSKNYVTLDELAKVLTTPAWEGLKDPRSKISRVLLSKAFCREIG